MTSMYVLGEYILRNGLLIMMKTKRSKAALMRDGMNAAKMAGREAEPSFDCDLVSLVSLVTAAQKC